MKSLGKRPIVTFFFVLIVKALSQKIDLNTTTIMHTWSREFSRRRVMTATVTFLNLVAECNKYRNIVRPLFVILLDTKESINEFANATKNGIHLENYYSRPVWLVLFFPRLPFESFCRHPTDNIFNVQFNTVMLVVCYDQPILTEWYAVTNNCTRTFEFATWSADRGLNLTTQTSFYARRSDLFGEVLRVASVYESPFIFLENGTVTGFFGELMVELSKAVNFKMQFLDQVDAYGSWDRQKESWTGVVGQLVANQADIGVGEFSMTPHRLDVVDFSLPLIQSRDQIYVRQPDGSEVYLLGYLKVFDFRIWAVILIVIICSPILLAIIKAKGRISIDLLMENYMHVWGLFCQQGLSVFPNELPMRLAVFSISVSSLIIQAAYSASFISFLTHPMGSLPFSDIEGYVADGSYKLIVIKNSAIYDMFNLTENSILMKMNALMKEKQQLPNTWTDAFKQVCEEKNVAFYSPEVFAKTSKLQCKVVFIESGYPECLGLILRKESPYTGVFNYHIQRFINNGVLSKLKSKHLAMMNLPEDKPDKVSLWSITPILAMMVAGMVLAIFILCLEKAYYVFKIRRKSNRFDMKLRTRNIQKNLWLQPSNIMNYGRPIGYWP